MLCQAPDWIQYTVLGLAVFPHILTFLPTQYQGVAGVAYKILSTIAGNYGNCKNATVDEQDKVTPRP